MTDNQQLPSKEVLQEAHDIMRGYTGDNATWAMAALDFIDRTGFSPTQVLLQAAQYVLTNHDELGGRE